MPIIEEIKGPSTAITSCLNVDSSPHQKNGFGIYDCIDEFEVFDRHRLYFYTQLPNRKARVKSTWGHLYNALHSYKLRHHITMEEAFQRHRKLTLNQHSYSIPCPEILQHNFHHNDPRHVDSQTESRHRSSQHTDSQNNDHQPSNPQPSETIDLTEANVERVLERILLKRGSLSLTVENNLQSSTVEEEHSILQNETSSLQRDNPVLQNDNPNVDTTNLEIVLNSNPHGDNQLLIDDYNSDDDDDSLHDFDSLEHDDKLLAHNDDSVLVDSVIHEDPFLHDNEHQYIESECNHQGSNIRDEQLTQTKKRKSKLEYRTSVTKKQKNNNHIHMNALNDIPFPDETTWTPEARSHSLSRLPLLKLLEKYHADQATLSSKIVTLTFRPVGCHFQTNTVAVWVEYLEKSHAIRFDGQDWHVISRLWEPNPASVLLSTNQELRLAEKRFFEDLTH